MKLLIPILCLVGCGYSNDNSTNAQRSGAIRSCPVLSVHFSPHGGVTDSLVKGIELAEHQIRVSAFSFTSKPISEALVEAKRSGKTVEVILDSENLRNPNSAIHKLHDAGITIYIDSKHNIAHNKIIVVDNNRVFTGSFNFSKGAEESNAENSISISDVGITKLYLDNWELHRDHSRLYSPDE